MSRIISKLNLNKTPQLVESNSMIFAKNIKLLKDGSLGQDDSIVKLNDLDFGDFAIRGIIPYNTKFYILLHNNLNDTSAIWEYDEKVTPHVRVCDCNWHWSGGIIDGNCVVNLNGDILLNIIEYKEDDSILVPLKTINISESSVNDDESIYTQVPKIPLFNLSFIDYYNNNIPAGTYQFFIRYEIRDNFYTNWFPVSKELFAGAKRQSLTNQGYLKYIDDSIDSGISFHFRVDKYYNSPIQFKSFQVGFILSHDETIVARSWKHFPMSTGEIYFDYNKEYIEELDVTDLTSTNYGLYNIRNLTSFKNKLYISNYIESDFNPKPTQEENPDLYNFLEEEGVDHELKNVKVQIKTKNVETSFNKYDYTDLNNVFHTYKINIDTDNVGDYYVREIIDENSTTPIPVNNIIETLLNNDHFTQIIDSEDPYDTHSYTIDDLGIRLWFTLNYDGTVDEQHYHSDTYYIHDTPYEDGHDRWPSNPGLFTSDYNDIVDYITSQLLYFKSNGNFYDRVNSSANAKPDHFYLTRFYGADNSFYCTYMIRFTVFPDGISLADTTYASDLYTLMPGQSYKFYIHFVKNTGEYTNGYYVAEKSIDFDTYATDIRNHNVIYPAFLFKRDLPSDYVACFMSMVHCKNNTSELFDARGKYASSLDFDIRLYSDYDKLHIHDITNDTDTIATYYPSYDSTNFKTFGSKGKMQLEDDTHAGHNMFVILPYDGNEEYSQLIKLTPYIIPDTSLSDYIYDNSEQLNLQSYICNVFVLADNYDLYVAGDEIYKKTIENETITIDDLTETEFRNWINYGYSVNYDSHSTPIGYNFTIYSNYNLNYLTLVNDLNPKIVRKTFEENNVKTEVSGFSLHNQSMLLSEVYELKSMFKTYTRKLYQVYNPDAIIKFDNTVRSSMLEGDEAKVNIFKFNAVDYYNVPTDKGIIINLKAVGEAIIVHTQDSLYKFTGSNSLMTAGGEDVAMKEGEPFDTGIQEIFGSRYGFAGLQHKHQHILSENGYSFYDSDANVIYLFNGQQQMNTISDDINKLLHHKPIKDIQFANDYYNDRFFIEITFSDDTFTNLSFNFKSRSFISIHDFKFDNSFNTKTKCYFIKKDGNNKQKEIYVVKDEASRSYNGLAEEEDIYPTKEGFTFTGDTYVANTENASIVDIILSEDYANVKTLNAISWVCNLINGFSNTGKIKSKFVAEESLTPYPGAFVRIYTDSTSTDLIDIHKASNPYSISITESYKYPRYNLGQWTLNYFRNILNTDDITHSDRRENPNIPPRPIADQQSLIYGKYIVIRFVFSNEDNFKLEDVNYNIAPYN